MLKKYPEILLVNLDKLTYAGNLENLKDVEGDPRHVFVQGDICDKELVESLFAKYDFDYVINFAAESHVDRSIKNPEIFVQSNVMGTVNLGGRPPRPSGFPDCLRRSAYPDWPAGSPGIS